MLQSLNYRAVLYSPAFWMVVALAVYMLVGISPAHASNGGGSGMPWESPIQKLSDSISGPVAFGIALLGILGCGFTLIWGGEVSEFLRRIMYLVLVVCLIVAAKNLLGSTLFNAALIPDAATLKSLSLATAKL